MIAAYQSPLEGLRLVPSQAQILTAMAEKLPRRFQHAIEQRYAWTLKKRRWVDAATFLEWAEKTVSGLAVKLSSGDEDLRRFAEARADECGRLALMWQDKDALLNAMRNVALRYGILPPDGHNVTPSGARARLLCPLWWRRAVRRYVGRNVEGAAIALGLVHRKAGIYSSNETVRRRAGQKARNRALLETIKAINESGQEYTLQQLSDLGTSNPVKRRNELMVRIAGFDQLAKLNGHAADFYTITCPSKYHARDSITGKENPKYNGATPRDAQAYLVKLWARIRAALHRRRIAVYGVRVAEPHHDGCPHWHMVLFMEQRHVETVRETMRSYALAEDGTEPGADKHRFTAKAIDRSKGNAAGYLAKYISKNIDGHGMDSDDYEGGSVDDNTARVDAWAACWGIRQFQQIGGAPVTVWRELRRLDAGEVVDPILAALVTAADMGGDEENQLNGWARFINLMGGWNVRRAELTARVWRAGAVDVETGEIRYNRYGELAGAVVRGVLCLGEATLTRVHTWVFERQGRKAAQPRSSVNNCTGGLHEQEKTGRRIGREGGENGSGGAVFHVGGGNPRSVDGDGGATGGFWRRD